MSRAVIIVGRNHLELMDTLFYVHPKDIHHDSNYLQLTGQEARHAAKVLRKKAGDSILCADGEGTHYACKIKQIQKESISLMVQTTEQQTFPAKQKILALGAIKKRDRFEFALEKAVELGVTELCVFQADHSERARINEERLNLLLLSAFKQSGRFWLPKISIVDSAEEVTAAFTAAKHIVAHETVLPEQHIPELQAQNILWVGPEGGLSTREINYLSTLSAEIISLGSLRLRAETAVTALLSQYLFTE